MLSNRDFTFLYLKLEYFKIITYNCFNNKISIISNTFATNLNRNESIIYIV